MSVVRLRPICSVLTTSPVVGSTRWIRARRRAATQTAVGLVVIEPMPHAYWTDATVCPDSGSIFSSVSGAPSPGTSATQIALLVAATELAGPGSLIGLPIGRPVL